MLKKQHIKRKSTMKAFLLYCTLNCWILLLLLLLDMLQNSRYITVIISITLAGTLFHSFFCATSRGKYMDSQIINEILFVTGFSSAMIIKQFWVFN